MGGAARPAGRTAESAAGRRAPAGPRPGTWGRRSPSGDSMGHLEDGLAEARRTEQGPPARRAVRSGIEERGNRSGAQRRPPGTDPGKAGHCLAWVRVAVAARGRGRWPLVLQVK